MHALKKWSMCGRKEGFETLARANKTRRRYGENKFYVYECPICFLWHIARHKREKLSG